MANWAPSWTQTNHWPIILLGPPGSGKSSLGQAACQILGLRFLDLSVSLVD
ncbi:AAA family ATPase [Desulfonatronum parangueonense]